MEGVEMVKEAEAKVERVKRTAEGVQAKGRKPDVVVVKGVSGGGGGRGDERSGVGGAQVKEVHMEGVSGGSEGGGDKGKVKSKRVEWRRRA